MSEETKPSRREWIEKMFEDKPNILPKHRDLLAMLASSLMGNPDAAQYFYNRAIVDGATDQELARMVEIGKAAGVEIGDVVANLERAAEERRDAADAGDDATPSPPNPN